MNAYVWFACDTMSRIQSLPSVSHLRLKSREEEKALSLMHLLSAKRLCAVRNHTTNVNLVQQVSALEYTDGNV